MNTMPHKILAMLIGLGISFAASAQTAYDCRSIAATTKKTFERTVQTGRREVGRTAEQGGAMDHPRPAANVSCETEKWEQMAAATLASKYHFGGGDMAALAIAALMNTLINAACDKLNAEVERARGRVENVVRPPNYELEFPYEWGN